MRDETSPPAPLLKEERGETSPPAPLLTGEGGDIYFIGIGGAGLSALAQVMLGRGFRVSGSDSAAPNAVTAQLEKMGARIFSTHAAENIAGADVVVVTSAAHADNPEVAAARLQNIPILQRREFLRAVTRANDVVAIAGSHGKTTTTAMLARIFQDAAFDPTVVVGGTIREWGTNARVGASKWFVIEADEYGYAFLGLEPKIAVVTNVEYDHPDLFATRQDYRNAFAEFLNQTCAEGAIVVCGDERAASELADATQRSVFRYGVGEKNDWRAVNVRANDSGGSDFEILRASDFVGEVSLRIPGQHNVLNALGAVTAAHVAGVRFETARAALEIFSGVGRRFEIRGMFRGATIVDDYAHHPTEIRATLRAARMRFPKARVIALFQPHTFSRMLALWDEFANAFAEADEILIVEIYAARERNEGGVSSRALVEQISNARARWVKTLAEAETILQMELRAGDVLLTLGAGDVNQVAIRLVENGNA